MSKRVRWRRDGTTYVTEVSGVTCRYWVDAGGWHMAGVHHPGGWWCTLARTTAAAAKSAAVRFARGIERACALCAGLGRPCDEHDGRAAADPDCVGCDEPTDPHEISDDGFCRHCLAEMADDD